MSDIWIIGCMAFVFGAICEFIVVKYLKWRSQQMKDAKEEQENYLKQNGLLQNFSPPPPPRISNDLHKMAAPNVVYPSDYGHHRLPYSHNNPWVKDLTISILLIDFFCTCMCTVKNLYFIP